MSQSQSCPFCTDIESRIINSNHLAIAVEDAHPVSLSHTLVIPKKHEADWFQLSDDEKTACLKLLELQKDKIQQQDQRVTGFNIGINNGVDAGQTVMHCHIHLIPRRHADVDNPKGGIRHIIPGKGCY